MCFCVVIGARGSAGAVDAAASSWAQSGDLGFFWSALRWGSVVGGGGGLWAAFGPDVEEVDVLHCGVQVWSVFLLDNGTVIFRVRCIPVRNPSITHRFNVAEC